MVSQNMSRLNGRVSNTNIPHNPVHCQPVPPPTQQYNTGGQVISHYRTKENEYEPSCLVRTPSGNVYIPSEGPQTHCTEDPRIQNPDLLTPIKGNRKAMESFSTQFGRMPLQNHLTEGRPSYNDDGRRSNFHFCTWRITAIIFIILACVLIVILGFLTARNLLPLPPSIGGCGVLVDETSGARDDIKESNQSPARGNFRLRGRREVFIDHGIYNSPNFRGEILPRMRRSVSHDVKHSMKSLHTLSTTNVPLQTLAVDNNKNKGVSSLTLPKSVTTKSPHAPNNKIHQPLSHLIFPKFVFENLDSSSTLNVGDDKNSPETPVDNTGKKRVDFSNLQNVPAVSFDTVINIAEYSDTEEGSGVDSLMKEDSLTYEFGSTPSQQPEEDVATESSLSDEIIAAMIDSQLDNDTFLAIDDLPPVGEKDLVFRERGDPIISLRKGDSIYNFDAASPNKLPLKHNSSDLNFRSESSHQFMADDPQSYSSGQQNLWNLGWLFNTKKPDSQKAETKEVIKNESIILSHPNDTNELQDQGYVPDNSIYEYKLNDKAGMGKKTFEPFSTWSQDKFKKGGKDTISNLKPRKLKGFTKGGRITQIFMTSAKKDHYKRSARNEEDPIRVKTRKTKMLTDSYDDRTTANKYPVLNDMQVDLPSSTDSQQSPGDQMNTALDLFPHIFEYDLKEHDYYYDEAEDYWFDPYWTSEESESDTSSELDYKYPPFEYDPPSTSSPAPLNEIDKVTKEQLPSGLKSMSLTRDGFIIDISSNTKFLSTNNGSKNEPVLVDSPPVFGYNDEEEVEIVPLESNIPKEDLYSPSARKIIHKTANDVYIQSTITPTTKVVEKQPDSPLIVEPGFEVITEKNNLSDIGISVSISNELSVDVEPFVDTRPTAVNSVFSVNSDPSVNSNPSVNFDPSINSNPSVNSDPSVNTDPSVDIVPYVDTEATVDTEPFIEINSSVDTEPSKNIERDLDTAPPISDSSSKSTTMGNFVEKISTLSPVLKSSNVVTPDSKNLEFANIEINSKDTQHLIPISNKRHPKRVNVNVTIGTEDDGDSNATRRENPIYMLSISIPTWGENQRPEINIINPFLAAYRDHQYQRVDNNVNESRNKIHSELSSSSPSDQCSCPCDCLGESKSTVNSSKLANTSLPESNCSLSDANLASTSEKIVPALSTEIFLEMKEHQQRPNQTIPPDGTTFKMIELGQKVKHKIPPYGYWNMQFYQPESAYVKLEVGVPRGASLGIYGRRNALPTHTSYDFLQVLSGYKVGNGRNARSSLAPVQIETIVKYLDQGHWFLSVYNDDGDPQELALVAEISSEFTEGCPKGCSSNGDCILGSCQCYPGFTGPDCTQMKCPVLCTGNGEYREGECLCRPGWKGKECSVRHDECQVPDCNGHGHCVDGRCLCAKGFKGQFCQDVDCPHPLCSGHGWCMNGTCICQKGWRGPDCARMDDTALECLPDCSAHGHFDLVGQQCVCDPEWTGSECDKRVCGLDCGIHGTCEGNQCICADGWTGDRCSLMVCDSRCVDHGQCKNGTCICMAGWNGRHCTLPGCPGSCSGYGSCIMLDDEWKCSCQNGWEGLDCASKLEDICDDGIDNDQDDLVDCADAECCASSQCSKSTLCRSSIDPIDILLRKQPPAVTASFFQRMRFIVEENSVQVYAKINSFNQSRSSVVRGQILSGRGSGLIGVRVSHYRPKDTGFSLSRLGGWFDLMVNGGGAVKLHFGKSQFRPLTITVWVPWNEIVVIDNVIMTTAEVIPPPAPSPCSHHDYLALKPVVLATWKHGFQGGCPQCSAILTESQVVQESLSMPGTGLHLVYHSSRALGYESTIQLQLTPSKIPEALRRIYLKITLEGILFEKTFEADVDIKYTYAWNRLNVYRQRVYGVTWAVVRVGYAYSDCDNAIWDTQSTQVSGHDMSVSDIGGWDLSIHNRYNFHEGILQKGDGTKIYLKQQPRILKTLMGDGRQREVNCRNCDGPARKQRLLTPAALAAAPDGSIYVADFNLIRKIFPDRTVKTIVKLNETRVSYRYHLAVSPVDGSVYISDPEAHQILKVNDPHDTSHPERNFMTYVGSGERCLPGDEIGCGDGGLARDAKLQYPKGMTVSSKEVLYFADGTNVRAVDSDQIISTIIGTHQHRSHWQPLPCFGTLSVVDIALRWPTSIAVNPLDESLYILDDHHILRLTKDSRVKIIVGRPLHCPPITKNNPVDAAAVTTLRAPQSITFSPNGDLYIVESDSERINRIRIISTDERIHEIAGAESKCNCREETCKCFDESHVLAAKSIFSTISSIAVTPDGAVHVLDQGNLRIRSVVASIPQPTKNRNYEIFSPELQEMYIFNRFGHHIETRNIPTQRTIYIFLYNVNTSNGKLSSITDASGNKINFLRDYTGQVTMIENSRQQKSRLKMSRMRRLVQMVTPDGHNVTLTYYSTTGLLRSRMDSMGKAHIYDYDKYGRLTRTVTPSGQVIDLSFDLSEVGARVTVTRDSRTAVTMLIKGSSVAETVGSASTVTSRLPDGSLITKNAWGHRISTETVSYVLLYNNILANSFPVPGKQTTEINQELVNSFEWKYFVQSAGDAHVNQVGRKMVVNSDHLLTFKYDMMSGTEAVLDKRNNVLLNVTYDDLGRPLKWTPMEPFEPVSLVYDRYSLLQEWVWGNRKEDYIYDRSGRFEGISYADGTKIIYSYKDADSTKPYKVSVQGGTEHLLEYDEGGSLSGIVTPQGHKYQFQTQPSVLHNRFTFTPPDSHHPYQILYTDSGQLQAIVLPQQAGRVIFSYDESNRLQHQIFGDGSVEYGYLPQTGLVHSITLRELAYEQRIDNKYHGGLIKEQRIRFGPAVPLNAAKMQFLYDGNARPRRVEIEINGQNLEDFEFKYNMILGSLENINGFRFTSPSYNKTVVQDSRKTMQKISIVNSHGCIFEEALIIHGRLIHRLRYSYDLRGRISSKTTWRGAGSTEFQSNYSYTPEGALRSVEGSESWHFRYDANGNMISVAEGSREVTAIYDSADRLVGWGDDEINSYDAAGRVIRQRDMHLSYTARGNIRHAWKQGNYRVTFRHDHNGRLTSLEDHHGNVTQFFYADMRRPHLPTHLHYPSRSLTHTLLYDHKDHLFALQTENAKYWVVTDHVGSPVAVYDTSGVMVKEIIRSPWGETLRDSRHDLQLHVDFFGSIRDTVTGLLIFQQHAYDPVHGQWMAPRYDKIPNTLDHIGSLYLHRFNDNNPINNKASTRIHYTDTSDWLKLFNIDMSRILGSNYHDETLDNIDPVMMKPSLRVISGLSCSKDGVLDHFSRPAMLPKSLVQVDEPHLTSDNWSMLGKFSSSGPVLGPGVLLSKISGKVVVTLVPHRENSVVQAVARDVLNGSSLLDVILPHHKHHTLYLVKKDLRSMEDDWAQLQRLSGLFNVTSHESEIRVVGETASLVLLYGTTAEIARHRLLRRVHRKAAEHAWLNEKRLLESGGPSLHPWSSQERTILLREGRVPGYVAAELHSVHRFPLLADDASNVVFRRDVDRRRRRAKSLS